MRPSGDLLNLLPDGLIILFQLLLSFPQGGQGGLTAALLALHLLNGHLDGFAVLLPGDVLHLQGSHLFGSFGDGRSQHFVGSHTLGRKPSQPLHLFGQFLHQLAAGDLLLAQLLHTGGQVIVFPQRLLV